MVKWKIIFTPKAAKEMKKAKSSGLAPKIQELLDLVRKDPFKYPPAYEKLLGDWEGFYSRRINVQHRFVYQVFSELRIVKIARVWTHYE